MMCYKNAEEASSIVAHWLGENFLGDNIAEGQAECLGLCRSFSLYSEKYGSALEDLGRAVTWSDFIKKNDISTFV